MAERDGAAVHIEPSRVDGQLAEAGECLGSERLVQFDEVDLVERESGQRERLANGRNRADAELLRFDPCRRIGDEARQRRQARALAIAALVTTTAAAPSLVCDELPAVTLPDT